MPKQNKMNHTIKQVANTSWIEFTSEVQNRETSETATIKLDFKKVFVFGVHKKVGVDGCFQEATIIFNAEHDRVFVYSTKSEQELTKSLDVLEKAFKAHS